MVLPIGAVDFFWQQYQFILPFLAVIWLVPPVLIWALSFLVAATKGQRRAIFLVFLAVTTTGVAAGYLAGASRESVMGDILPVLLTGFGAISALAVIQNKIRVEFAAIVVVVFGFTLFTSAIWGTHIRALYGADVQTHTSAFPEGLS